MWAKIPPSGLPAISPSRGKIGWSARVALPLLSQAPFCADEVRRGARSESISPLEGEMSGRTEGGSLSTPHLTGHPHAH
ncbi:diaminohydroxyphosphoribosylaminopyrimidine deaminase [Neorhizobium galegae]|nr:diaminohydroxyphosphoribosylaminopyrimidine deaminase [Neorhizobium galegae]KAB1114062.1 diaminohydroxyphosphoribosylaminopyrimidine deaminase [Neorhizobium galegae]CDZ25794.1 Hypothetical protein NGAL_HAMBI490_06280 [Neorhizobium galegae bv. officinalis]